MSDQDNQQAPSTYEVSGVTITVIGGGYYDLSVPGRDVERVRGKEAADARAAEIAAEIAPSDDKFANGNFDAAAAAFASPEDVAAAAAMQTQTDTTSDELAQLRTENEALKAQDELTRLRAENEALKAQVATVVTTGQAPTGRLEATVPNRFVGVMTDEQKAAIGVATSRIVLEDNPDIPPTGLFVSHNGRSYMIQPGVTVDVPDFVLEILDNAVVALPVLDSKSQRVLGYRDRSKYPYRRVNA